MTATKQFCLRGHDRLVVGTTTRRECRACRRERQTTDVYRSQRRVRQQRPERLEKRRRYRWLVDNPRFWALRLGKAISQLDPRLVSK